MPLAKIQIDILRLLASHRDPESYVAGSTPLNRDAPRYSGDIAIFHDREERVARAAEQDSVLLQKHGYALKWLRREPNIYAVLAERADETTKLEWVVDSEFRFFPTLRDENFGYVLHPVDLTTNKVAAAYGRREPRDVVDLLTIHDQILPMGAVVWASAGKALGFTPEGIINEIRRVARYTDADFRRLDSDPPLDPAATMTRLREVLSDAESFITRWCSQTPAACKTIKRTQGSSAATGPATPKSPQPCSSARRTTNDISRNLSGSASRSRSKTAPDRPQEILPCVSQRVFCGTPVRVKSGVKHPMGLIYARRESRSHGRSPVHRRGFLCQLCGTTGAAWS